MTRRLMLLAGLLIAGSALGCGGDDEGEELPDVDCTMDVPTYGEVTGFTKCATCHGSTVSGAARNSAPADINFDTYAGAEAHATKAAEEVHEGAMPPSGSGVTLTDTEKDLLIRWALCGAMQ